MSRPPSHSHSPKPSTTSASASRIRPITRMTIMGLPRAGPPLPIVPRSEEHTSELQSLMRISYAVFCLKKKQQTSLMSSTYTSTYFYIGYEDHINNSQQSKCSVYSDSC